MSSQDVPPPSGLTDQTEVAPTATSERLMTSVANQRLWIEAKPGTDPPAAGPALALAWEGTDVEYLICDTSTPGAGKLAWVNADNVHNASIRAPLSTTSLTHERLWIKTKPGTAPVAEGNALAVQTDEHTTEYLVCHGGEGDAGQLVWVNADNIEAASIKKPTPSRLPTKKVARAGTGGATAAVLATAIVALLEPLGVDTTSELSAAVTSFVTAAAAFAAAYFRTDPAAVNTPAAAEAAASPAV